MTLNPDTLAAIEDIKRSVIFTIGVAHGRYHKAHPLTCDDPLCASSRLIEQRLNALLRSEAGGEPRLTAERLFEVFSDLNDGHTMSLAFWRKFLAALSPSPEATPTPAWAKEDQDVPT